MIGWRKGLSKKNISVSLDCYRNHFFLFMSANIWLENSFTLIITSYDWSFDLSPDGKVISTSLLMIESKVLNIFFIYLSHCFFSLFFFFFVVVVVVIFCFLGFFALYIYSWWNFQKSAVKCHVIPSYICTPDSSHFSLCYFYSSETFYLF